MTYNGLELVEADGKNYQLGPTPKRMFVWDDCDGVLMERDVLGFFNGFWIAAFPDGKGVHNWHHAAEIPTKLETPLTYRELGRWLAEGNGEYTHEGWDNVYTSFCYNKSSADKHLNDDYLIRKKNDEEWHKATREYAFGENAG